MGLALTPNMTLDELQHRARAIEVEWTCAAAGLLPPAVRIDAHCHLGLDSDGSSVTPAELTEQLTDSAIDHALVTALHHPEGYVDANRELAAWAAGSGGRFLPLWRVDPNRHDAADDATRGFASGAVGIKLHPRAEAFSMAAPGVSAVAQVVDGERGLVLIHAGRGMPALGQQVLQLAIDFPGATFVLAHAAVSDLSWVVEAARDVPNLVFDTSWWSTVDIAALLSTAHPSRVVFGSDPPYGTVAFGLMSAARVARSVGWDDACVTALFGGNIARILGDRAPEGARALACDPATLTAPQATPSILEPHSWALRRCGSYLGGAVAASVASGDPTEQLELALRALEVPASHSEHSAAMTLAAGLDVAIAAYALEERRIGLWTVISVMVHALTPGIAIPPLPGLSHAG